MDIKHQVFVSSTYKDLIEARKAVIYALLELDCIPSGMELFPAADEDAWSLIKEVIDGCDYYILILAGKYGSTNKDGISYTEMEFDYAVSKQKPIICFLFEKLDDLSLGDTEKNESAQNKLIQFRKKAESKHCKYWTNADDLGGKVSRSLIQLKKRHPSPGWIPGIYAMSEEVIEELQVLREKVSKYEHEKAIKTSELKEISKLAQGEDSVKITNNLQFDKDGNFRKITLTSTWNELLSYFGPSMINECTEQELFKKIKLCYYHKLDDDVRQFNTLESIILAYVFEDKIRVQYQALGIIAPGLKRRTVKDSNTYWRLTPYGESLLLSIKAIKREA